MREELNFCFTIQNNQECVKIRFCNKILRCKKYGVIYFNTNFIAKVVSYIFMSRTTKVEVISQQFYKCYLRVF